jgi:hypothetical protein
VVAATSIPIGTLFVVCLFFLNEVKFCLFEMNAKQVMRKDAGMEEKISAGSSVPRA